MVCATQIGTTGYMQHNPPPTRPGNEAKRLASYHSWLCSATAILLPARHLCVVNHVCTSMQYDMYNYVHLLHIDQEIQMVFIVHFLCTDDVQCMNAQIRDYHTELSSPLPESQGWPLLPGGARPPSGDPQSLQPTVECDHPTENVC